MRRVLALATLLLFTWPAMALAADPFERGIDPVVQKPAATADGFLTLEGARTRTKGSHHLSLLADYGDGLLSLRLGDEYLGRLIERRLDLHLIGGWALASWLEVAADVPLTVFQDDGFDELRDGSGLNESSPGSAGIGDVRVVGKARLLDESVAPITVAMLLEARLPTGAGDDFLGGGLLLSPRLAVERTFAQRLRVAFEAGYRYRSEPGRYLNLYVGDELTFGLAGAYAATDRTTILAELLTATPARGPFNAPDADALKTGLEGLLGVRQHLGGDLSAQLAAGTGLSADPGLGRESFRVLASVRYEKRVDDRDGDGIPDSEDACPDDPEDRDGFEDSDGCPDPDNDRDGIPDTEDLCPLVPGPKEYDGCPDRDGDEIPDVEDACPDQKGPAQNEGCPADDPLAVYEGGKISLNGAINFDSGRATIQRDSFPVLDEIARMLREHPELRKIRVDGHTDSVGSDRFNLQLSRRRAKAVVDYLAKAGIERGRIAHKGFGESKPIASNRTPLGRAKNRRVEFTVLEMAPPPSASR